MKAHTLRILRRLSQGIFLFLFLFLFIQTESKGQDELGYPVRIFLDFDPLIALSTLLSAHTLVAGFFLSLIVVALTVFLGRIFCGWICPLGTLHDSVGSFNRRKTGRTSSNRHTLKYYILIFLLASSLFTVQVTGIMDPISLLIRSLSLSVYPLVNYLAGAFFDTLYFLDIPVATEVSEWVYDILRRAVLSFDQPHFFQGIFMGTLFFLILGLNLYERRFWCRYLCPLGALLGVLSRYALLKRSVSEGCTACGVCRRACASGAVIDGKGTWRGSECPYCMDCDDLCPEGAISFGWKGSREGVPVDLSRRNVFLSLTAGVAVVPLLRIVPWSGGGWRNPSLIRPPGALGEREFLSRCVRCGECMKVCITNGLQPTLFEAGLEGVWTPRLVPKVGYCEFRCTLCGQVCPTGAIVDLTVPEKQKTKIGMAVIDTGRCLPYAYDIPCIVCEEMCPTPEKAIWLEEVTVRSRAGGEIILKRPRVDVARCVGCGICETRCPVQARPAIYVISTNESRSEGNRLLLNP